MGGHQKLETLPNAPGLLVAKIFNALKVVKLWWAFKEWSRQRLCFVCRLKFQRKYGHTPVWIVTGNTCDSDVSSPLRYSYLPSRSTGWGENAIVAAHHKSVPVCPSTGRRHSPSVHWLDFCSSSPHRRSGKIAGRRSCALQSWNVTIGHHCLGPPDAGQTTQPRGRVCTRRQAKDDPAKLQLHAGAARAPKSPQYVTLHDHANMNKTEPIYPI